MPFENTLYICLGSMLTTTNLLIFTTIMIHKALRNHKEYVLMGMLVLFNSLVGLGFFSAGMFRSYLTPENNITTRATCLTLPHIYLFAGTPCAVSLLLPFIAIDRFVAVTRPLFYYSLHKQYAFYIVTGMLLFYIFCFLFAVTQALANPGIVPSYCDTRAVFGAIYKRFEAATVAVGHLSAVVIYLMVIFAFRKKTHRKLGRDPRCEHLVDKRRWRIVQTFGIFAFVTFVIVVLPYSIVLIADYTLSTQSRYRSILNHCYLVSTKLATLNPTLNVVLYALRHNEIYMGMRTMLRGQPMPDSTEQWRVCDSVPSFRRAMSLQNTPRHKYSLAHYQMMRQVDGDRNRRERKDTDLKSDTEKTTRI